jgi:hypothetical protein
VILNATTNETLTTSQKVLLHNFLKTPYNNNNKFYIYIDNDKFHIENTVLSKFSIPEVQQVSENLLDLIPLASIPKAGEKLIKFNDLLEKANELKKKDDELSSFLSSAKYQATPTDVFTDDMSSLVTLLEDRQRKTLSDNLMGKLDKFIALMKRNLPKDNVVLITEFTSYEPSIEVALRSLRALLANVGFNIFSAITFQNKDDFTKFLPSSVDVIKSENYSSIPDANSINIITISSFDLSPAFAMFLQSVIKKNPKLLVLLFDFEKQDIDLQLVSDVLKKYKVPESLMDDAFIEMNVIDAIKMRIVSLNQNGKLHLKAQGGKTFDRDQFAKDILELQSIIDVYKVSNQDARDNLSFIIREYADALSLIDYITRTDKGVIEKIHSLVKLPQKINEMNADEQTKTLKLMDDMLITFGEKEFKGEAFKYRRIITGLNENEDLFFGDKKPLKKGTQNKQDTLDYILSTDFLQNATQEYNDKIKILGGYETNVENIAHKKATIMKLKVLRKLFDQIYRLKYAENDVIVQKIHHKLDRFILKKENLSNDAIYMLYDKALDTLRSNAENMERTISQLGKYDENTVVDTILKQLDETTTELLKRDNNYHYDVLSKHIRTNVKLFADNKNSILAKMEKRQKSRSRF